jgi:hypothetical protein
MGGRVGVGAKAVNLASGYEKHPEGWTPSEVQRAARWTTMLKSFRRLRKFFAVRGCWYSAGLQPAVSPISDRQSVRFSALAGWKPAIQQVGNLRYFGLRPAGTDGPTDEQAWEYLCPTFRELHNWDAVGTRALPWREADCQFALHGSAFPALD